MSQYQPIISSSARTWNDLAADVTRCSYFEAIGDSTEVVAVADAADPELARRQFKAARTSLLCAKARALARLGKHGGADAALATAVRSCPRGAVDPLIVLEASKALCFSLRGDAAKGEVHYDRALAAYAPSATAITSPGSSAIGATSAAR